MEHISQPIQRILARLLAGEPPCPEESKRTNPHQEAAGAEA
jgi:hypothetical protein